MSEGDTYVGLLTSLMLMEAATLTDPEKGWCVEDFAHRQGIIVDEKAKLSGQVKNEEHL
ncbi:hypothetical protein PMIN05_003647 [Paraphaeosphaeria minitans]